MATVQPKTGLSTILDLYVSARATRATRLVHGMKSRWSLRVALQEETEEQLNQKSIELTQEQEAEENGHPKNDPCKSPEAVQGQTL